MRLRKRTNSAREKKKNFLIYKMGQKWKKICCKASEKGKESRKICPDMQIWVEVRVKAKYIKQYGDSKFESSVKGLILLRSPRRLE